MIDQLPEYLQHVLLHLLRCLDYRGIQINKIRGYFETPRL